MCLYKIVKSDKSCISNPKLDNRGLDCARCGVRFEISDFGFEMQDLSDFTISRFLPYALFPNANPNSTSERIATPDGPFGKYGFSSSFQAVLAMSRCTHGVLPTNS
jgi:hypothetical protein